MYPSSVGLTRIPCGQANQHAANADDFLAQGLLVPAAEEHTKAAEAYTAAIERCTDESVRPLHIRAHHFSCLLLF